MRFSRSKSRRKHLKPALFEFNDLEQRNLLASFSGTNGDDIVTLQENDPLLAGWQKSASDALQMVYSGKSAGLRR